MRSLTLALLALLTVPGVVFAHGGGFRGPNGGVPPGLRPRGLFCFCALVKCSHCANDALRTGKNYVRGDVRTTVLRHWGDIELVRVTLTFRTEQDVGAVEGFARLRLAPVFAAVGGQVQAHGTASPLIARLRDSEPARRTYLWIRQTKLIDPLLVMRREPGVVDVRAFPVTSEAPLRVAIEGYRLIPRKGVPGMRIYRTGERYLTVAADGKHEFLSRDDCRRRHGTAAAIIVPCVPALETAATDRGNAAAGAKRVLAAYPNGSKPGPMAAADASPPPPPPPSTTPQP